MPTSEYRYPYYTFLIFRDKWNKKKVFHREPLSDETVGFMEYKKAVWTKIIRLNGTPEFRIETEIIQKAPENE